MDGVDLDGVRRRVPVATGTGRVLLLFLSSSCDGCAPFWPVAADPARLGLSEGERVVVVGRDPAAEDLVALGHLVDRSATVVLAGAAWQAYRVQGPPFFALVDPAVGVVTEGVAWAVGQVAADVARVGAREDRAAGSTADLPGEGAAPTAHAPRVGSHAHRGSPHVDRPAPPAEGEGWRGPR